MIREDPQNKCLFLKFEAAQTIDDVFFNGIHLGQHIGGYSAFTFEVTEHVKVNEINEVRVEVDNTYNDSVIPIAGDFIIYGGLTRPVSIIITNKISTTPLNYTSPGVYITQKLVTEEKAEVSILTKVANQYESVKDISIKVRIFDELDIKILKEES